MKRAVRTMLGGKVSRRALCLAAVLLAWIPHGASKPEYSSLAAAGHPAFHLQDAAKCPLASQCPELQNLLKKGVDIEAYLQSKDAQELRKACPYLAEQSDELINEIKNAGSASAAAGAAGCPYLAAQARGDSLERQLEEDLPSAADCPLVSQCPKIQELLAQGIDIKQYLKQYSYTDLKKSCPYLANKKSDFVKELAEGGSTKCPYLAAHAQARLRTSGKLDPVRPPAGLDQILYDLPIVRQLNSQKKALRAERSTIAHDLFQTLFPFTSPAHNSLLATFYISSVPNILLMLVPANIDMRSLNTLVAFATGGLLGDCFFHLLPQTFLGEHQDDNVHFVMVEERRNVILGIAIFLGFAMFVVIDKSMRIFAGPESTHSHVVKEAASLDELPESEDDPSAASSAVQVSDVSQTYELRNRSVKSPSKSSRSRSKSPEKTAQLQHTRQNGHAKPAERKTSQSIKLSAYLNLVADFTHNSTDGLAIAASFYLSPTVGAATSLGVFLHEVPHELGDSALLIKGGFTRRAAMLSQFVTATGAFLGVLIGIWIQERGLSHHKSTGLHGGALSTASDAAGLFGSSATFADLVIPFTAGGFLYVACLGAIPELLENVTGDKRKDLVQFVKELVAMAGGMAIMFAIAWNEA